MAWIGVTLQARAISAFKNRRIFSLEMEKKSCPRRTHTIHVDIPGSQARFTKWWFLLDDDDDDDEEEEDEDDDDDDDDDEPLLKKWWFINKPPYKKWWLDFQGYVYLHVVDFYGKCS